MVQIIVKGFLGALSLRFLLLEIKSGSNFKAISMKL